MSISAVVGKDTTIINNRILRNFADGDTVKLDAPEPLTNMITGKNLNAIYAYSYKGKNMKMELRLMVGSPDDQFLVGLLQQYNQNPPAFALMSMEFDKQIGDGSGNIATVVYLGSGMTFEYQPSIVENVSGETVQAVHVWKLVIANVDISVT